MASKELRVLAIMLDEIRTTLRATAITKDFFHGYSLGEAILDRMEHIGKLKDATKTFDGGGHMSTRVLKTKRGAPTLQSRLLYLKEQAFGKDGQSGIIAQVKELDATIEEVSEATTVEAKG